MDQQSQFVPLKIDAVIADAEAMENATGAFELAEVIQLRVHDLLRQTAKFAENLQLEFFGHARKLRRARGIEDDLERAHQAVVS